MVRFIETIKFDLAFARAVYDAFYDPEKQYMDFYGKRFKYKDEFDGWPDYLDMENFIIDYIGADSIVFLSGGDWQEMIPVTLCLRNNSHKLVWSPCGSYTQKSKSEIKLGLKDLVSCVQSFAEDCQIAGPIMGSLPPNVGSTLSLGYKSGRILLLPKKKADTKDYNSIPHF